MASGLSPNVKTEIEQCLHLPVPLATLISATKLPSGSANNVILSPDGRKRYFVVHGGLFSKDGVTLDDIRKVQRIGRQPGQEGLMCKSSLYNRSTSMALTRVYIHSIGEVCISRSRR